jgi:hypothetical protein
MTRSNGTAVSSANGHSKTSEKKRPIEVEVSSTQPAKRPKLSERTDYTRWRLLDERGRQTWHYLEDDEDAKEWPQSTADKYFLNLPTVRFTNENTVTMLTSNRAFPISLLRRRRSIRSRIALNSSSTCNYPQGTGAASMADLCFYFLAS